LALVAVVALAGLRDAGAAPGDSPADAAKGALDDADRAEAANRLPDAIEALKKAYELTGDTNLLFRLGDLTAKIGQETSAIRFYRAYLTRDPRGKHRPAAERQVRLLEDRQQLSGGAARVPSPGVAPVATGPAVAVAPQPKAPPPRDSNPPAAPPTVPAANLAPTPAPAEDRPSAPSVDLRVDAAPPAALAVEPPLPRWLPWTGLAASVALGAAAAVTGLGASHRYDELLSSCGATATGCSDSEIDEVRSKARTANLLWVGAGVMAAATGVAVYANTREAGFSGLWRF
jgi:hypothetical protein